MVSTGTFTTCAGAPNMTISLVNGVNPLQTTLLELGIVSGRVALLLRSAEIQPVFGRFVTEWHSPFPPPHLAAFCYRASRPARARTAPKCSPGAPVWSLAEVFGQKRNPFQGLKCLWCTFANCLHLATGRGHVHSSAAKSSIVQIALFCYRARVCYRASRTMRGNPRTRHGRPSASQVYIEVHAPCAMLRSYHHEHTRSHQNSEVKRGWA